MKNKLLVSLLLTFGYAGVSFAAPNITQYITPATSQAVGTGVVTGTSPTGNQLSNGCNNQTLISQGGTVIRGIEVGSSGTAQCVLISDTTSCTPSGATTGVFEACSAANTSTYFDFSNSPIRIKNGIMVTTSRTDGFAAVYTP